jgi:hypothetical protein
VKLKEVAPLLGKAQEQIEAERNRGISRCWQHFGYHVYGAGPCFDTLDAAIRYRDSLDAEGKTWRPQR